MKQIASITFLLLMAAQVYSQALRNDTVISGSERLFQPKKMDYHLTLGSQFSSVSGFGSALNTYVAPHLSYNVSKRFRIGAGISIIQTNYFNARSFYGSEQGATTSSNFTSATISIDGQYILSNRLTIYGSAYKQFPVTHDPLPYNPFNPVSSRGAQGVNVNLLYKIGDHVFIQAGFRYQDGVNPFYSDPFNRGTFMNDGYGVQSCFGTPRW
ncbi:MAG: hypothetical protein ACOYNC_13925 [Bacteroidales bacterium]